MRPPTLVVVVALALLAPAHAGESCCAKKARLAKLKFIPDPDAQPPDIDAEGNARLIPKPGEVKPAGWDDDDDGPWEAAQVENPSFRWSPQLIPNPDYNPPTFADELQTEFNKALPWVVLGILITAALSQLPMKDKLATLLDGAGPLGGAVLGLCTPLCSCGALPVAAGFVSRGVPLSTVVAFLIASQSAGLDSAAITWGLLGPLATCCRLAGALVLATCAGIAAGRGLVKTARASAASDGGAKAAATAGNADKGAGAFSGAASLLVALGKAAVASAAEIGPPVLLGLALSTGAVRWLPALTQISSGHRFDEVAGDLASTAPDAAADASGWVRSLLIRAVVLASSVPLQLCEHSTVTLAAALQKAGGGAGLAFAFLLAAPAVNLPSLLLLLSAGVDGRSSDRFAAVRVALTLTASALVLSYAIDYSGVDLLIEQEAESAAGASMDLPEALVLISPWVAGALATAAVVQAIAQRMRASTSSPAADCAGEGELDACCKVNTAETMPKRRQQSKQGATKAVQPQRRAPSPARQPLSVTRERRSSSSLGKSRASQSPARKRSATRKG